MNDMPKIIAGLAVGLVVLTFPLWYTVAAGGPGEPPQLVLPADESQCVESSQSMRAHHMELLNQWRDEVVRQGKTSPVEIGGKQYPKSLTRGCMSCHTSKENFCERCHNYANVRLTCWECHVAPGEI
jgi:hypothetical protein